MSAPCPAAPSELATHPAASRLLPPAPCLAALRRAKSASSAPQVRRPMHRARQSIVAPYHLVAAAPNRRSKQISVRLDHRPPGCPPTAQRPPAAYRSAALQNRSTP